MKTIKYLTKIFKEPYSVYPKEYYGEFETINRDEDFDLVIDDDCEFVGFHTEGDSKLVITAPDKYDDGRKYVRFDNKLMNMFPDGYLTMLIFEKGECFPPEKWDYCRAVGNIQS